MRRDCTARVVRSRPCARCVLVLARAPPARTARADDSKLAKEDVPLQTKATLRGKNKLCCGYPLVDDLQWALRFYWLVLEDDYQDPRAPTCRGAAAARTVPIEHVGRALHARGLLLRPRLRALRVGAPPRGLGPDDGRPRHQLHRHVQLTATAPASSSSTSREHPFGRGAGHAPADPVQVGRGRSARDPDRRAALHPRVRRPACSPTARSTTAACAPTTPAAASRSARWTSSS